MHRVKIRLSKIQQDVLLTPKTSLTGIRSKKLIKSDYCNYLQDDQYPKYIRQKHDTQTEQHDTIERQIRTDTLLSRQLQEEERNQAIKSNYQTEYDDPLPYHIDRGQVKLEDNYEPTLVTENKPLVRFDTHQVTDYHDEQENRDFPHENAFRVFPGKCKPENRECDRKILHYTTYNNFPLSTKNLHSIWHERYEKTTTHKFRYIPRSNKVS